MSFETKSAESDSENSTPQLDKVIKSLELIIDLQDERNQRDNDLLGVVNERMNKIEQIIGQFVSQRNSFQLDAPGSGDEKSEEEQRTDWQAQKAKILAEYGIEKEDEEDDSPAVRAAKTKSQPTANSAQWETGDFEEGEDDEYEYEYADEVKLSEEHEKEIERLKIDLREKIGKAEVELSIKQAKLEQQEARIEEKQAQLERREQELAKANNMQSHENGPGVLGRLKRHLNLIAMIRGDHKPDPESEAKERKLDAKISMIAKPKASKSNQPNPDTGLESQQPAVKISAKTGNDESEKVASEQNPEPDPVDESIEEAILDSVKEATIESAKSLKSEVVEQPAVAAKTTSKRKSARRRKKRRSKS